MGFLHSFAFFSFSLFFFGKVISFHGAKLLNLSAVSYTKPDASVFLSLIYLKSRFNKILHFFFPSVFVILQVNATAQFLSMI